MYRRGRERGLFVSRDSVPGAKVQNEHLDHVGNGAVFPVGGRA